MARRINNTSKIEELEKDYHSLMDKAMVSNTELFFDLVKQANSKIDKIYTIRKKEALKSKYGKANGFADELKVNILL